MKTTMYIQLRKLNLMFRFTELKFDMFYDISFTKYEIRLQGKLNNNILNYCFNNKFIVDFNSVAITFKRSNITISLTK